MVSQAHLMKLVDLAISGPDASAIHLGHLKTLLLGILQVTNYEDSLVETTARGEKAQTDDSDVNDNELEQELQRSKIFPLEAVQDEQKIHDQMDLLEKKQSFMNDRLMSLEKSIESVEKFPSNEEILNASIEPSSLNGVESELLPAKKLTLVWQDMKIKSRLQAAEDAIDKLFSLMNDILVKVSGDDGMKSNFDEQVIQDLKNDLNELKKKQELLENLSNNNTTLNNDNMLEKLNGLEEEIGQNRSNISVCHNDIDQVRDSVHLLSERLDAKGESDSNGNAASSNDVKTFSEELEKVKNDLSKKMNASLADELSSKMKDLQEDLNLLKTKMKNDNADSLGFVNLAEDMKQNIDMADFNSLQERVNANEVKIDDLLKEMNQLRETISNFDNSDLKNIMDSIDQLKKMSNEIEDLRKLSTLKDLADNVADLKQLADNIDKLNAVTKENSENVGKMGEEFSSVTDQLSRMSNAHNDLAIQLKNLKDMLKLQKPIDGGQVDSMSNKMDEREGDGSNVNFDELMKLVEESNKKMKELESNMESLYAKQNEMLRNNDITDQGKSPTPSFDASVLGAIQHLAQQNRQQIAAVQAELSILQKISKPKVSDNQHDEAATQLVTQPDSSGGDKELLENLHNHLHALQEEQVQLAGNMANTFDDIKDEFNRKQQHVDALYEYIDQLQNNKADKGDINSEMDVKADKHALDGKVNMSTFDERYQLLEQALQDALNRLDHYVNKEANLKDALNKLNQDLNTKMDSDAEKKLKKFFENRLKEIQISRTNLPDNSETIEFDMRNAAGLRKPMPLSYHCISCDRPIDVTMRGVMPPVPQNFPSKRSMGPYTSFELDQMRQARRTPQQTYDKVPAQRPCGGYHTSVNTTMYRAQKLTPVQTTSIDASDAIEKTSDQEENSVVDCVLGKDGQIYRGRFKQNGRPPPLPKRIPHQNGRSNKFHSRHKHIHSANVAKASNFLVTDEGRAHSAVEKFTQNSEDRMSDKPIAQVSFPPISRDGSLVSDEFQVLQDDSSHESVN